MTIKHHTGEIVKKGEELGNFNLGGSAIVMAFQPNQIQFIEKIQRSAASSVVQTSDQYRGPWIKVGEKIATAMPVRSLP